LFHAFAGEALISAFARAGCTLVAFGEGAGAGALEALRPETSFISAYSPQRRTFGRSNAPRSRPKALLAPNNLLGSYN
jgi:hypothetical protein